VTPGGPGRPGGPRPPSTRQLRAGELVRRALVEALAEGHLRDPALSGASITVSEVRASPDLKHASAFVMPLGGSEAPEILAALKRARSYLRTEVARRVQLRHAPELHFELDRSFDESARVERLLRSDAVKRDLA
jgi:ribosome-binding factor A